MCDSPQHPHHLHLQFFRLVCFSIFWINKEAFLLTTLCLTWFAVTIFSLGHILPCSITCGSSMSRQLQLIIIQKKVDELLCKGELNHILVVLVSILACFCFLCVLVASNPCLTLSALVITCIYLF